jgi:CRP/FNR family transcriptional regulator
MDPKYILTHNQCLTCGHKHCAKKVSLFSNLNEEDLDQVVQLITRRRLIKGETVFRIGDSSDSLYIVNSGSLKVFCLNRDGREQILYLLKEGEFLGDVHLLKSGTFDYEATALEETHLCVIRKADFDRLILERPEISIKLLAYAHDRIVDLEELIQTLTTNDADARLASLLISLAKSSGVQTEEGIEVALTISREDMARYIGLTRETISRKLGQFSSAGILYFKDNKHLVIKDLSRLSDYDAIGRN